MKERIATSRALRVRMLLPRLLSMLEEVQHERGVQVRQP
jgi:hypothetical protein